MIYLWPCGTPMVAMLRIGTRVIDPVGMYGRDGAAKTETPEAKRGKVQFSIFSDPGGKSRSSGCPPF
jgi:hypothetical protein